MGASGILSATLDDLMHIVPQIGLGGASFQFRYMIVLFGKSGLDNVHLIVQRRSLLVYQAPIEIGGRLSSVTRV